MALPVYAGASAPRYSRAEVLSDMVLHILSLVLALAAVPVLITLTAVWRGDAGSVTGVSVYGGLLILMLSASLAYNHARAPTWWPFLRRLDMSVIQLKIAGTYTPFALLTGTGWGLMTGIWSAAALTAGLTLTVRRVPPGLGVVVCLGLGWAVVIGGRDLLAGLPQAVVVLMVLGGVLYSLGAVFLLASRLRFHVAIWHGFVLVASAVFFVAVFLCMALGPETA